MRCTGWLEWSIWSGTYFRLGMSSGIGLTKSDVRVILTSWPMGYIFKGFAKPTNMFFCFSLDGDGGAHETLCPWAPWGG